MKKVSIKEKKIKWLAVLTAIFFILLSLAIIIILFQNVFYKDKIYPGIKIGGLELGGKTKKQVFVLLEQYTQKFSQEGIVFSAENNSGKIKRVRISPVIISPQDPDLSREILNFNAKETLEKLYSAGRQGNFYERLGEILNNLIFNKKEQIIYHLDKNELDKILKDNFKNFESPAINAALEIKNQIFEISLEKEGIAFDYKKGLADLENNINNLIYQPVELKTIIEAPKITKIEGEKYLEQAYQMTGLDPFKLTYKENWWLLRNPKEFLNLKLSKEGKIYLGLDQDKFSAFLQNIAKDLDLEPKDAEFEMKDGKVISFKPSKTGVKLNIEKSIDKIEEDLIKLKKEESEMIIEEKEPKISIAEINNLGIQGLIGAGMSNFSGSPQNRRHNIKTGAEKLNGVLIKPGEEFSLNGALGKIGPDEGFLPELVIKGNRTVPEYGGGLCQIGTTAFRVALNTGLPITERRPHSYRVSYYEPAGMDATIYNPHPDLRFINDTPAHILFLTRIEGDELTFEFWGTNDERKIEVTKPIISNIKKPGPARYLESETLKPGEIKMIERAHDGADAEFTRTVIYSAPEKEKLEETWTSRYKPWQAVYLIPKTSTTSEKIIKE
ncbi:MAG: hypothetical protein Athens101410_139 [Parcubacteria group bacterium Athens1014_10]|nr:MAG: hypothetical protein Athens101410_139 [Parcubacteria group bacterium Athens1014_10]TSD05892.1 MAG: hypothetical protein Athens071412_174 [Parcubacteria group bacterium Athens0714_12]